MQDLPTNEARSAVAGSHGRDIRSDCRITVWEAGPASGPQLEPQIQVRSKVAALYGDAIRRQAAEQVAAMRAADLRLLIEDSGALPFTLAARLEAAVRRLRPEHTPAVLPPRNPAGQNRPAGRRLRRTRLYLPGTTPKLLINAGLYGADAVILDLEDSVPLGEKDAARLLVRNALRAVDFYGAEKMVRVNQLPEGLEDMQALAPHGVDVFVLPKVEDPQEVIEAAALLDCMEAETGPGILLIPIIESAAGVLDAAAIARAAPRVTALAIGLEDYTSDIGAQRTPEGRESEWACAQVLNAARAAGVQPLASVYSDVQDMAGLRQWAHAMRLAGFEGVGCLHPSQIAVVHEVYTPTPAEIEEAAAIVAAYEQALAGGSAVVARNGRMIDPPVVKRAQATLARAQVGAAEGGA